MNNLRYNPKFKDEAVRQVIDRGYSVPDLAQRLGVSVHSLYKWVNAVKPYQSDEKTEESKRAKQEILKLKTDLRHTEDERNILKKAPGTSPKAPTLGASQPE